MQQKTVNYSKVAGWNWMVGIVCLELHGWNGMVGMACLRVGMACPRVGMACPRVGMAWTGFCLIPTAVKSVSPAQLSKFKLTV